MVEKHVLEMVTFEFPQLHRFCVDVVRALGSSAENAAIVADALLEADLRGIGSHGISRLPVYAKRVGLGLMDSRAMPVLVQENPCTALLDGNNGFGQVGAFEGMKRCMAKAKSMGVGMVGVKNTNHIGMAAFYTLMAARERQVGLVCANASAHMAAWGGLKGCLGTNPISVGIPGRDGGSVLLDMSTSAVARGKIIAAARTGKPIPLGWAMDGDGHPTQDANKALEGFILPLGGHKGYGLSLVCDILAGVLTGSLFGSQIPSMISDWTRPLNCGVWMLSFSIENFMDFEHFVERLDTLTADLKSSPLAPGFEKIYLPGEIEAQTREERFCQGIPLEGEVVRELESVSELTGVPLKSKRTQYVLQV